MYSPQGWICGSSDDTDICDFQLAHNNQTGVSKRHIRFDVEPRTNRARMTVISRNSVQVRIGFDERKRKRIVILHQGQALEIVDTVTIDLGEVSFRAWQPLLTAQEQIQYRKNAEQFSEDFLNAIPKFPVNLDANGDSTFTMKFGANNACYKVHDPGATRTGSFASVYKVQELRTQKVFAAKVPHFRMTDAASTSRKNWENLKDEFWRLSQLHHVRDAYLKTPVTASKKLM